MPVNPYFNAIRPPVYKNTGIVSAPKSEAATKKFDISAAMTKGNVTSAADNLKTDIKNELDGIFKASSSGFSAAVFITDAAFGKMGTTAEFKNEIMTALRDEASSSHQLPYDALAKITVSENGYSAFSRNNYPNDTSDDKEINKEWFNNQAKDAFFVKNPTSNQDVGALWSRTLSERKLWEKNFMNVQV